jgi:hypothetical protein
MKQIVDLMLEEQQGQTTFIQAMVLGRVRRVPRVVH